MFSPILDISSKYLSLFSKSSLLSSICFIFLVSFINIVSLIKLFIKFNISILSNGDDFIISNKSSTLSLSKLRLPSLSKKLRALYSFLSIS